MSVATPVHSGNYLLVTQFYRGSLMMRLDQDRPDATLLWMGQSRSEMPGETEGLHALITTPLIDGDNILRCRQLRRVARLNARTGERLWMSGEMTAQARWGTAFMVKHDDRYFVVNDDGILILAEFTPAGYVEHGRVPLIEPTADAGFGPRRAFDRKVNWSHPGVRQRPHRASQRQRDHPRVAAGRRLPVTRGQSRRDFVKRVGAAAGAAALPPAAVAALGQAPPAGPAFPLETPRSVFPTLNRRTRGWLRFLWDKATTDDDWSSAGIPHQWWDRYSVPVVLSYGRFDLSFSSYAILLMADQTPAWREIYTEIADGLAGRYPTYWGAIDWLTQIGDDPKRANYPPRVMNQIPDRLKGNYNRFGWTANGVDPWGLQRDPIVRRRIPVLPRLVHPVALDLQVRLGRRQVHAAVSGHRIRGRGLRVGPPPDRRAHGAAVLWTIPKARSARTPRSGSIATAPAGSACICTTGSSAARPTAPSRISSSIPVTTTWGSEMTARWSGSRTTTTRW